jgi:hypothetical protein
VISKKKKNLLGRPTQEVLHHISTRYTPGAIRIFY